MIVSLINYTPNAMETLIFTKNTRLNMNAASFRDIMDWSEQKKMEELDYMAKTIPSSWEFVDYTFMIEGVSRAFTHQFVRNRQGSYAQQSMRVTDMGGFRYHTGPGVDSDAQKSMYAGAMQTIGVRYNELVHQGVPIEDARGVLPTNILTNIVAKYNLRTMSDLARSRTGGRTQSEFRTVMGLMVDEILSVHPWAEKFLFSQDRNFFEELEIAASGITNGAEKALVLKAVDGLRKTL